MSLIVQDEFAEAARTPHTPGTSAVDRLEAALSGLDTNRASRGPRNLPRPDARKQRRQNAKAARKRNR